ncbi:hypothetical protein ACL598_07445 [Bordetella bronchialis]|uniref:hypothetical protein n=1 Tax=Bordetella bronchialis TaxID=463025 RepID=UPI003D07EAB5
MLPLPARGAARQRGAAAASFAITALPLLFGALFVVEAARWHVVRQMLSLALLEAARAGATAHARPAIIEQAFEDALLPLFHPPGPHGDARARMRAAFLDVARTAGAPPWRIDVLSPGSRAYADFGDAALRVAGAPGLPAINNDYQAEQHLRRRRMGWAGGRGPLSGQTIFEANMLRLRLTYVHPPLVPGLRAILKRLAAMRDGNGPEASHPAARAGMLVMAMESALPMQSHPVLWGAATGGAPTAVSRPPASRGPGKAGASPKGPLVSWQFRGHGQDTPSRAKDGAQKGHVPLGNAREPHAHASPATEAAPGGPFRDPACGVQLCCLPPASSR